MKSITIALAACLLVGLGVAFAEDFIQGWMPGEPVNLSGVGKEVFDSAMFASDGWWMDSGSSGLTPSMSAFRKDNPDDGKPLGEPAKKAAFVGSVWAAKNGNVSPEGVPA